MALKIELLSREDHNRESFDCGSEPLNGYLRQSARQHAERGISRTYVLVDDAGTKPLAILGFFTISMCQISSEELPQPIARRFPREIAGLKMGRLAIAKAHQRQGLGRVLVVEAMRKCLAVSEVAGGIGLFVDAKDEAARAYYERFGFISLPPDPLQMFLPLETARRELTEGEAR